MPTIRPFRALRYDPEVVGDIALVVSPPDVVASPAEVQALLARHPKNIARLDVPTDQLGDGPDERYRRAARTFAAWRSDGTFHRDRRPSLYAYEQVPAGPGSDGVRTWRGFFGRLRLEASAPGSIAVPLEAIDDARTEDRYRLLRASGANVSPVVGIFRDEAGRADVLLRSIAERIPDVDIVRDDGTRHRLWVVPDVAAERVDGARAAVDTGGDTGLAGIAEELIAAAGSGPIRIVDGHDQYAAALRYRDERRTGHVDDGDAPFDFVLALLLGIAGPDDPTDLRPRALCGLVVNPHEW